MVAAARARGVDARVMDATRLAFHGEFEAVFSNDDDASYKAAQKVLEGRYTWLDEGIADPSGDGPMISGQPEGVPDAPPVTANGDEPVAAAAAG